MMVRITAHFHNSRASRTKRGSRANDRGLEHAKYAVTELVPISGGIIIFGRDYLVIFIVYSLGHRLRFKSVATRMVLCGGREV